MEDDLNKKMEDDLKKNGRRPQKKNGRGPQNKMEDDLNFFWHTTIQPKST